MNLSHEAGIFSEIHPADILPQLKLVGVCQKVEYVFKRSKAYIFRVLKKSKNPGQTKSSESDQAITNSQVKL